LTDPQIDPRVPPTGAGCAECDDVGGWWVHLRRCAACGHIGCCDTSPAKHATAHFRETGHRYVRSFEPGESWYWDYVAEETVQGPPLAPPEWRPEEQPSPGPAGRVPQDWRSQLARVNAA